MHQFIDSLVVLVVSETGTHSAFSKTVETPLVQFLDWFMPVVWRSGGFGNLMLYMLALVGQPSLRGRDACMVFRANGASWRKCRQFFRKTSFSPLFVFSVESNFWYFMRWSGSLASLDWSC